MAQKLRPQRQEKQEKITLRRVAGKRLPAEQTCEEQGQGGDGIDRPDVGQDGKSLSQRTPQKEVGRSAERSDKRKEIP